MKSATASMITARCRSRALSNEMILISIADLRACDTMLFLKYARRNRKNKPLPPQSRSITSVMVLRMAFYEKHALIWKIREYSNGFGLVKADEAIRPIKVLIRILRPTYLQSAAPSGDPKHRDG